MYDILFMEHYEEYKLISKGYSKLDPHMIEKE